MASLHGHVEELELEEPCEERAVVLQLPGEEEARREPSRSDLSPPPAPPPRAGRAPSPSRNPRSGSYRRLL